MMAMITYETTRSAPRLTGELRFIWCLEVFYAQLSPRDDSEGKRVKLVCAFSDERTGKNRSITDVDWSPKVRQAQLL